MPQYGTWSPYTGAEAIRLAAALFVIAAILTIVALRLTGPLRPRQSGYFSAFVLALILLVSLVTLVVGAGTYLNALMAAYGKFAAPPSPISPVTDLCVLGSFVTIIVLSRRAGWKIALLSAVVGTMAAPFIFELPFDLIVMGHLYPVPPEPTWINTLSFFLPLYLIALTCFGLLAVSPLVKLSRYTLLCLAGFFLVFSVWALFGFSYPSQPLPLAFNVTGKLLAFAAAVTLFIP